MKIDLKNSNTILGNDDKILEQIVEKNGSPKMYFEKVVRSNDYDNNDNDNEYETFHFKIGSIKQPKLKWYNPFSWFNKSTILEDCEFVELGEIQKMNDIELLIADCRLLEVDSKPDGYPAIQMRQISMLCDAVENAIPALDRLQDRLERGANIRFQDNKWCLFQKDGELICSGKTVRMMLINLIFTDC